MANPRASVTVAIQQFVNVLTTPTNQGGGICTSTITLNNPINGVIDQPTPNGSLIVQDVVDIVFELAGASGYRLAGIAFKDRTRVPLSKKKSAKAARKGNGNDNMPKDKISIKEDPNGDTRLRITDDFIDAGKPPYQPKWEIYLMVQDDAGTIGIVDPDIENQN